MQLMFFFGLALACIGLAGVIAAIVFANSIRRRNPKGDEAKSALAKLIYLNHASLFVAAIGLCAMVAAVILG